jgi:TPR repeat protein
LSGALFIALALCACRKSASSSQPHGAEKPIDVASLIAGCTDLDDCNRQCSENRPNTCVSAGRMYEFGHDTVPDPSRAFHLYERACDLDYAGGCYNAAVLLEAAKGIEKDLKRAHQLYAKVCAMRSTTACARAEEIEHAAR